MKKKNARLEANMQSTRAQIRALYKENRNISSEEIIARLKITPNPKFWQILNEVQVDLRGTYPDRRKNRGFRQHL